MCSALCQSQPSPPPPNLLLLLLLLVLSDAEKANAPCQQGRRCCRCCFNHACRKRTADERCSTHLRNICMKYTSNSAQTHVQLDELLEEAGKYLHLNS